MQANLRDFWRSLETRGQITIVISGLLVAITFFFLYQMASAPSYSTISSGLDPADAGRAANALAGAGIPYKLADGGTTLEVAKGQESQARVTLAEKGVLDSGHVNFSIFDKSNLAVTDFQQKVNYQRALEGQIATVIEEMDGVNRAEVQLVIPDDNLFQDQTSKASAAVLLSGPVSSDAASVSGIAHLVAASVKGLDASDVTITDDTGTLLWPTNDSTSGSADAKLQAERDYNDQLSAQLNSLLASVLGANKAEARVNADLSLDQKQIDQTTYQKGTPSSVQTDNETLQSKGGGATTPSGTGSNIPTYGSTGSSNGTSNYKHVTSTTQYGTDKTESTTIVAPGTINKLSVALLIDSSVPAGQVNALKQAIASAAGISTARGDTLAVSRIKFAAPAAATAAKKGLPIPMGVAKIAGAIVAAAIFLFFMRRNLRRRETESLSAEPSWLREIEGARRIAEIEAGRPRPPDEQEVQRKVLHQEIETLAQDQPEQLAAQVGDWVRERE